MYNIFNPRTFKFQFCVCRITLWIMDNSVGSKGYPCRLCQSDVPLFSSPLPHWTWTQQSTVQRNEAFKKSILVVRAAAVIFQSLKSMEKFSNSTTTWIKISLKTTEFPLLWIYALQTIYKLQILFSTYLNIRKGINKCSTS